MDLTKSVISTKDPYHNDEEGDNSSIVQKEDAHFTIGDVVDVMPRLWPGINKPGGVGRVYGVHFDEGTESMFSYSAYLLLL